MSFAVALCAAVLLNAVDRLLTRRTLRDHDLADEFLLVYQLVCTVLTAPFAVASLLRPSAASGGILPIPGFLLIVATIAMWALYSVAAFRSARRLELSVGSTIGRLRIVLTAGLGVLFFGETLGPIAIVGVGLLLLAFIPISRLPSRQLNRTGVAYALVSTFAISLAMLADKALTQWLQPEMIVFIGFAGTTAIAFALNRGTRISHARPILVPAVVAGAAGAVGYYLLVVALATGPASLILPVYQASALLYVIAGIVLLGEKDGWRRKLLAGLIAAVGTGLLMSG